MEEEVEIRDYLRVVIRRWKVVAAVFVVAFAVAVIVSFIQKPPTPLYDASVTLVEPTYQMIVDNQLLSPDEQKQRLYPSLAVSPAIEQQVAQALDPVLSAAEKEPGGLLAMVRVVEEKTNPALFEISVRADDPHKAVRIANTWAEKYVELVAELGPGSTELGFIRAQLDDAERDLAETQDALTEYEQETGVGIVAAGMDPYAYLGHRGKELEEKIMLLVDHRVARDSLLFLIQSAQRIKEVGGEIGDLPLELLNVAAITDRGYLSPELIREQGDNIDAVIALLEEEKEVISSVVGVLAQEVAGLQEQLTAEKFQVDSLVRELEVALETHAALSRRLQELEMQQKATRIISPATAPSSVAPLGPSKKVGLGIAVLFGLLVGIMAAFGLEYLEGSTQREKEAGIEG